MILSVFIAVHRCSSPVQNLFDQRLTVMNGDKRPKK